MPSHPSHGGEGQRGTLFSSKSIYLTSWGGSEGGGGVPLPPDAHTSISHRWEGPRTGPPCPALQHTTASAVDTGCWSLSHQRCWAVLALTSKQTTLCALVSDPGTWGAPALCTLAIKMAVLGGYTSFCGAACMAAAARATAAVTAIRIALSRAATRVLLCQWSPHLLQSLSTTFVTISTNQRIIY